MRLVLLSNLYPNPEEPFRATYNRRLIKAIAKQIGKASISVIGTIYWCPLVDSLLRKRKKPPKKTQLDGISVSHPRMFYTPGFLIHKHHFFYRFALRRTLQKISKTSGNPPHIIIAFVYPDAVAMAPICRELGLSYSVMVLGSDFRVRLKQPRFRSMVMNCLEEASTIFCPGKALKHDMVAKGISPDKIIPFDNGVEHEIFQFRNKTTESAKLVHEELELGEAPVLNILFVGNLLDVKAPQRLIRAFKFLLQSKQPDQITDNSKSSIHLNIVGDGPLRPNLMKLTTDLGIAEQVTFHGRKTPECIAEMMQSANCLCLCSRSEGMPNVVVEALACGCPVVATSVGEVPYLIEEGINGYLVEIHNLSEEAITDDLTHKLDQALIKPWDRELISSRMTNYSWETAATKILDAVGN
ncbi:glycosyltransferase [Rubellicoccus peritrichatus]|uniref:Glycosyltransferase n=1 Tax=Rubellicoccus peritrichatus TaxID=3080537 RepID=A0AAQ3QTL4_9BACT|nr:glycosyltransferase [Puniceicoccus sp. CR14]WOO41446.1 glycosyltransferase [Puniceicoccus sp. CR14]